ncbi:MAG: hypothetical protein HY296_03885 [Thaumarchaeota archaeon]|nr:hypothetical protein [Nitrososphaerota archaeon]
MDLIYLDAAQGLILAFGGTVVFYAVRAFLRTKSRAMLMLGLGFAFVTAGAVMAGVLFNTNGDLVAAETAQAASQAVGFLIIVYSFTGTKD